MNTGRGLKPQGERPDVLGDRVVPLLRGGRGLNPPPPSGGPPGGLVAVASAPPTRGGGEHDRCAHPLLTLLDKLDAMSRRYERDPMDAASFVRHHEDVVRTIRGIDGLPRLEIGSQELAQDLVADKVVRGLPRADDPALLLEDVDRREALEEAFRAIRLMFWGPRIPLEESTAEIRAWLDAQGWGT